MPKASRLDEMCGPMCPSSLTDVGHGIRESLSKCHSVTARGGVIRGLAEHAQEVVDTDDQGTQMIKAIA